MWIASSAKKSWVAQKIVITLLPNRSRFLKWIGLWNLCRHNGEPKEQKKPDYLTSIYRFANSKDTKYYPTRLKVNSVINHLPILFNYIKISKSFHLSNLWKFMKIWKPFELVSMKVHYFSPNLANAVKFDQNLITIAITITTESILRPLPNNCSRSKRPKVEITRHSDLKMKLSRRAASKKITLELSTYQW